MKLQIPAIERINFYNRDKVDKLHKSRAMKWLKLFLKAKRGDPKAIESIKKHEAEDRLLKARAMEAGYYWV